MSEQFKPLKPVKVVYMCDECKDVELHNTGSAVFVFPMKYVHSCFKCGGEFKLDKAYPYVKYVEGE